MAEAAAKGSRRDLMVAMRDRIALAVSDPKCPPRDLASLTRRLDAIAAEIESIDLRAQEEGSESDAADDDTFDPASV
ncbi:MAG: hypothetical protein PSX37_08650 [bacterium]|nr:hypothetical protein [bacterium]